MFCVLFGAVRVAWRELILVAVRVIRDAVIACTLHADLPYNSRGFEDYSSLNRTIEDRQLS